MEEIIFLAIQLAVTVGAFLVGKYVLPNIPPSASEKLEELSGWAEQFVVWAREFMKDSTGEEKMDKVVELMKEIADEAEIEVTDEQLKAIVQNAYEAMKAGEAQVNAAVAAQTAAAQTTPAPTVAIYNNMSSAEKEEEETEIIATDDVPEGATEPDENGMVKVYNEKMEQVGAITQEEAKKVEEKAVQNATNIKVEINQAAPEKEE